MSSVLKTAVAGLLVSLFLAACVTGGEGPSAVADEPENILQVGIPAPANEIFSNAPAVITAPAAAPTTGIAPAALPPAPLPPLVRPPDAGVGLAPARSPDTRNSYRMRPRDVVRVLVINEPDTLVERRINPDGTIDVPFLNQIIAIGGLTISEAQDSAALQFVRFFRKPQVVITIITYAERRVYVSGYVGKPGPISIPPEETLTLGRGLSMAGGVLPRGNRSTVTIKRTRDGSTQVIVKDVRLIDSGEEPDFVLEDEDQIYIEDRRF